MGIVVIGAVFIDIKGYSISPYIPAGRNAGKFECRWPYSYCIWWHHQGKLSSATWKCLCYISSRWKRKLVKSVVCLCLLTHNHTPIGNITTVDADLWAEIHEWKFWIPSWTESKRRGSEDKRIRRTGIYKYKNGRRAE